MSLANDHIRRLASGAWQDCERVVQRFELAWRQGPRPALDEYLPSSAALRQALLIELVHTELELRLEAGEGIGVETYLDRHPELLEDRTAVLELIATEYALRRRRQPDLSAESYVQRFPQFAADLPTWLAEASAAEQTPHGTAPPCLASASEGNWPNVKGYEILEELGRGGMGVVYKARQEGLKRLVALKMIRADVPTGPVELARFRTEAAAAARLQHPHIVQIHEIGTHEGRPYFSLEFVAGGSLAQHLAGTPLLAFRAAQLTETLARAVHHAHQSGVIHRDLKPANILLSFGREPSASATSALAEGSRLNEATLKITDFGLAKQLDGDARQTQSGAILGTPSYMAPEQASGRTQEIGPAVDVYALGAVLYEMLTGRPPFQGATLLDTLEHVRSHEPVPPRRLQPRLPRDLETICLKCLQKEPRQRYPSAEALAEDLGRFLHDEPIRARPTRLAERLGRWGRRNPGLATMTGLALALLVGGLLSVVWEWRRAEEQRLQADANFQKARAAVDECFTTVTENPILQEPGMEPARAVLLRTALKYYQDFLSQRSADPKIQAELAQAYIRVGYIIQQIGSQAEAVAAYEQARDLYEKLVSVEPANRTLQSALARCYQSLGNLYGSLGRLDAAEVALLRGLALQEELARTYPTVADYQNEVARSHSSLGQLYHSTGRPTQAETAYRQALAVREALTHNDPGNPAYRRALAQEYGALGYFCDKNSRPQEAEAHLRQALVHQEQLVQAYPAVADYQADLASSDNTLGSFYLNNNGSSGDQEKAYREALRLYEQLARDHPKVHSYQMKLARVHNNLALCYYLQRRFAEADAAYGKALTLRERLAQQFPEVHEYQRTLAKTYHDRGILYRKTGQLDQAEAAYRNALAIQEALVRDYPALHTVADELGCTLSNLGLLTLRQGRAHVALTLFDRAIDTLRAILQTVPRQANARRFLWEAHAGRAETYTALGRHVEALRDWDRACELCDPAAAPRYQLGRAATRARQGNHAQAVAEAEAVIAEFPTHGALLYEAARAYALSSPVVRAHSLLPSGDQEELSRRYADQAVALLLRARANGQFSTSASLDDLKTEKDLDTLRPRADFQELLALVQQPSKD
jgi:serine/threonine protein kinase/tetratricopeptide (TPR) repeat protein